LISIKFVLQGIKNYFKVHYNSTQMAGGLGGGENMANCKQFWEGFQVPGGVLSPNPKSPGGGERGKQVPEAGGFLSQYPKSPGGGKRRRCIGISIWEFPKCLREVSGEDVLEFQFGNSRNAWGR
jgi:hypothetical protein